MVTNRISVALCTYNGESFLREQLESIAAQTILPNELVVYDDCSVDQTLEIVYKFSETAPFPVRVYVNKNNIGVARNFFKAIISCKSEWVMLCDQDDIWLNNRVALFLNEIGLHHNAIVIQSNAILANSKMVSMKQSLFSAYRLTHREIRWINGGHAERVLVRHVFATGAGMVVSRDHICKMNEPEFGFLHDEWISWFASPNIFVLDQPTFIYRQHDRQVTGVNGHISARIQRFLKSMKQGALSIDQGLKRFEALYFLLNRERDSKSLTSIEMLYKKISFLKKRKMLPGCLLLRLFNILFVIKLPDYWKLSSGIRTLTKDILNTGML